MRTVTLTLLLALSTSLAAQITVTATGLPAGATGSVTVGKTTIKLGSAINLPNGTYAVQGAPIGVSAKVYVAKPLNVAIKGATTAKLNYIKLPPGSPDPLFGMGGQRKTAITGLPVFDHWYVLSSGPDLPVITSAGTSGNNRQQLVSLTGVALGPATPVQLRDGLVWRNPTPLIKDGSGYLAGVSDVFGTVVRYDSTGKQDSSWKTTPSLGPYVRGLLRLPDGGLLAYGGQSSPEVWKLSASGVADTTFGEGGRLSLANMDSSLRAFGKVKTARLMRDGNIRLAVIEDSLLALFDLSPDGKPKLVAPALRLPLAATSLDPAANVVIQPDGSVYVLTADSNSYQTQLVRVTPSGLRDPGFKAPPAANALSMAGVTVQPDGRVVIAYRTRDNDSRVIRYLPTGEIDQTFGSKGVVQLKDAIFGMEMGTDGKLYAVGAGVAEALVESSAFLRITRLLAE